MICQRPNRETDRGVPPPHWAVSTDQAGEVYGIICPSCVTGELLSLTAEDCLAADAA